MKKLLVALSLVVVSGAASAACYGSGSLKTCDDDNGNSYTVQRIGNSTYLDGHNSQTGSTWSQSSTTIGNTTYHDGTAANGQSWNGTSTRIGDSNFISGTDSQGNSYSKVCNQYGCY